MTKHPNRRTSQLIDWVGLGADSVKVLCLIWEWNWDWVLMFVLLFVLLYFSARPLNYIMSECIFLHKCQKLLQFEAVWDFLPNFLSAAIRVGRRLERSSFLLCILRKRPKLIFQFQKLHIMHIYICHSYNKYWCSHKSWSLWRWVAQTQGPENRKRGTRINLPCCWARGIYVAQIIQIITKINMLNS